MTEANKGNKLTEYDMIAAITQDTINMQFNLLWDKLPDKLKQMKWEFNQSNPDLGLDLHFKFSGAMNAPTVVLGTSSSPNFIVKLCVDIPSGTFTYGKGKIVEINNWKYVFDVNVNFTEIEKLEGICTSKDVLNMLKHFSDSQFTINHLFMNFQNSNIANFDESLSKLEFNLDSKVSDETKKLIISLFQTGMTNYFKGLKKEENPYILGFQIDDKAPEIDPTLEPTFKPTSGTYWIFKEVQEKEGLSTLNILTTTNNHPLPIKTEPNFKNNWVIDNDYDGRFIVASSCFMENFIIPKLKNALNMRLEGSKNPNDDHESMYTQKHDVIWKQTNPSAESNKWKLTYNCDSEWSADDVEGKPLSVYINADHKITNDFEFEISLQNPNPSKAVIKLEGSFHLEHHLECTPVGLTEEGWKSVKATWNVSITIEGGTEGVLKLTVEHTPGAKESDHGGNWLNKIDNALGGMNNLDDMIKWCMEGLEKELTSLISLFKGINNRFILPGGSVFAFCNPQFDEYQNLLTYITYKTPNQKHLS